MSRSLKPSRFSREAGLAYLEEEKQRLLALPEIVDVQWTTTAELSYLSDIQSDTVRLAKEAEGFEVASNSVTPGYFAMREIPLVRGRGIEGRDVLGSEPVAVVSRAFADRLWPGADALGQSFEVERDRAASTGGEPAVTLRVVGIADDGLYSDHSNPRQPYYWTALAQNYDWRLMLHVEGRPGLSPEELVAVLERRVERFADEVALIVPSTYRSMVELRLQSLRTVARALAGAGVFGLALASLGVYGLLSFIAVLRSREMAVRQALGASRPEVVRSLVREGLGLAAWGVVLGLAVGVSIAQVAREALFGVSPLDPWALVASSLLLLGAATAASLTPALRLSRESPVRRLRAD